MTTRPTSTANPNDWWTPDCFVAESEEFRRTLSQIETFAGSDVSPILIEGESGTGKTWLARHLHCVSRRREGRFHHVVLTTFEDSLSSSELFGHVAGAFTDARRPRNGHFVAARGGTLFLDEIGKATRSVQAKLLHVIEYKELTPVGADLPMRTDTHIVAATNVSLEELVRGGSFLSDLASRFGYFHVRVPPLRKRRRDIPGLVRQILERYTTRLGVEIPAIHPELMEALCAAKWPTNLRGLDSAIRYMLACSDRASELTFEHCSGPVAVELGTARRKRCTPAETVALVGKLGSVSAAARELGVPRSTIQRRMRKARGERERPDASDPDDGGDTGDGGNSGSDGVGPDKR